MPSDKESVSESDLLLVAFAVFFVTKRRLAYPTLHRWMRTGLKGPNGQRAKLRFVKCGMRPMTTVADVRAFFAALTPGDDLPGSYASTPTGGGSPSNLSAQRQRQKAAAEAICRANNI